MLITSCILAALIVASSSFAWFTSTDDVTNRLTASADYGVSIVESFAPPKQWIPGQIVNKDVYDVNTGNIAAFVNNDVSGILTYTYETTVNTFDSTNGVELTPTALTDIDGVTTMEAGSFLAWTDTTEPLETKISERQADASANRWTPTIAGVYVFRRAASGGVYTYAGYYYDGNGKYYKISIGNDINPNGNGVFDVSSNNLGGTAAVDPNTGVVISGTPSIKYVIETKVDAQPVSYTFDSANKRLKFEYTAAIAGASNNTYDASAAAARAEVEYQNANKYSQLADKLYANAKADLDYATTLANESNKLITAAIAAKTTSETTSGKEDIKDAAWDNIFGADKAFDTFDNSFSTAFVLSYTSLNPSTFVPDSVRNAANHQTGSTYDYPYVHANYQELADLYESMGDSARGYQKAINDAIATLVSYKSNATKDTLPADIQAKVDIIRTNLVDYQRDLAAFKQKYADLVDSAVTDASISVDTTTDGAKKTDIQNAINNLSAASGNADTLNTKADLYKNAYNAWDSARTTSDSKETDWTNAVTTYNTNVGGAKTNYDDAVTASAGQNHGKDLVNKNTGYSVTDRNATDNANPTIEAIDPNFADYASLLLKTVPVADTFPVELNWSDTNNYASHSNTETKTVAQWLEFKNDKANALATANDAYNDAQTKVTTSSTIKINVKLDDNYAANWTYDTRTDKTTLASFYLNKILDAGQTTPKLIDSVELDSSVTQYSYKELAFDLNVHLDSAQITYDNNDNATIKTDAVNSPAFAMTPSLTTPTDIGTTVKWATTAPPEGSRTYKVNTTVVTPVENGSGTLAASYPWKIVVDDSLASSLSVSAGTYVCETKAGTYKEIENQDTLKDPGNSFNVTAE